MPTSIFRTIRALSAELGISVITPDAEILLCLFARQEMAAEQLQALTSASRAGFWTALGRLRRYGIVESLRTGGDGRVTMNRLPGPVIERIVRNVSALYPLKPSFSSIMQVAKADQIGVERHNEAPLSYIRCGYQILLLLYDSPGRTFKDLANAVAYSETTFVRELQNLRDRELVFVEQTFADKRLRKYFLTPRATDALAAVKVEYTAWVKDVYEGKYT